LKTIKVRVYIDYGANKGVRVKDVKIPQGSSILDALKAVADVKYVESDAASGHLGAVVLEIDGVKADLNMSWVFYIYDKKTRDWAFPQVTADKVIVEDGSIVLWRYYSHKEEGFPPKTRPRVEVY